MVLPIWFWGLEPRLCWVDSKGLGTLCSPTGQAARTRVFFNYLCLWVCNGHGKQGKNNNDRNAYVVLGSSARMIFQNAQRTVSHLDLIPLIISLEPVKSKHKSFTWPRVTSISVLFSLLLVSPHFLWISEYIITPSPGSESLHMLSPWCTKPFLFPLPV